MFALLAETAPLWAQFPGPALLRRGEAPASISSPTVRFRPYAEVSAIYDTGLAGVLVKDASGTLANQASMGVQIAFGISGAHSRRHAKVDRAGPPLNSSTEWVA